MLITVPYQLDKSASYPSYPPPSLEFQPRDFGSAVETLIESNLTFNLVIGDDTPCPWREINQQLHAHLENNNLTIPLKQDDDGERYNRLSWDLASRGKAKRNGVIPFKTNQVYEPIFTTGYLRQMAITNPADGKLMLLLGEFNDETLYKCRQHYQYPSRGISGARLPSRIFAMRAFHGG